MCAIILRNPAIFPLPMAGATIARDPSEYDDRSRSFIIAINADREGMAQLPLGMPADTVTGTVFTRREGVCYADLTTNLTNWIAGFPGTN
jgi:hypothetical protein